MSGHASSLLREDPRVTAPLHYLDRGGLETAEILVCGAEVISIPLALAVTCSRLTLADASRERLDAVYLAAQNAGITNIDLLEATCFSALPARGRSYGLIVLNDSLGRAQDAAPALNPWDAQVNGLVACRRSLAPNGIIYVSAENRYGIDKLRVMPDDPPAGNSLSRIMSYALTNGCQLFYRGKGSSASTHTASRYRKLFETAGLQVLYSIFLYPNARQPSYMGPLGAYARLVRTRFTRRAMTGKKVAALHVLSHIPLARKLVQATVSTYGFFLAPEAQAGRSVLMPHADCCYVTNDGYIQARKGEQISYSHIPSHCDRKEDDTYLVQNLIRDSLRQGNRCDLLRFIPRAYAQADGWSVDLVRGHPLVGNAEWFAIHNRPGHIEGLYRRALDIIREIYRVIAKPKAANLRQYALACYDEYVEPYRSEHTEEMFDRGRDILSNIDANVMVDVSPIHGDVNPKNVHVDHSDITGYIDWAFAEREGVPSLDMANGIYAYLRHVLRCSYRDPRFWGEYVNLLNALDENPLCGTRDTFSFSALMLLVAIRHTIRCDRMRLTCKDELVGILTSHEDAFHEATH